MANETSEQIIQRLLNEGKITVSDAMTILKDLAEARANKGPQYPPMTPAYPNTPSIGGDRMPWEPPKIYCSGKGTTYNPTGPQTAGNSGDFRDGPMETWEDRCGHKQ